MRLRRVLPLLLLALLPASSAHAGGIPPTETNAGPGGVVSPNGAVRFGAFATRNGTVISKTSVSGGRVKRATVLQGRWEVPVVANDFTAGGLSADGSTLVLRRTPTTYPARSTLFGVLGAGHLGLRRTFELKGKWNFDAISPDASTLYLIQTPNPNRPRYAVRAYDLRAHRLLPDPIVDPSEPDEPMQGYPITRTTGPGGRWEYTLYAGGEHPFVHALDTVRRTSLCLDLPARVERRIWQNKLVLRGDRVEVVRRGKVVASAARRPQAASVGGGGPPWAAIAGLAGLLIAAGGLRRVRRAG